MWRGGGEEGVAVRARRGSRVRREKMGERVRCMVVDVLWWEGGDGDGEDERCGWEGRFSRGGLEYSEHRYKRINESSMLLLPQGLIASDMMPSTRDKCEGMSSSYVRMRS